MESEGGGNRKRKSGKIPLDWEKLLPSACPDDDPMPLLVVERARRKEAEVMESEDEDSSFDDFLRRLSDKELKEKIDRVKRALGGPGPMKLPDGGAKLRAALKNQEAELERRRRRLLKDDNKCKETIPIGEESACPVVDSSSHEAPASVADSKSAFAQRFCSQLDDKEASESFSEELSTLNRPNHKTMRGNKPLLSQRTQKLASSSRQLPFKSPNHLSVKTNGPNRSPKKDNGFWSEPNYNSRRNKKTVVLVDEELEADSKSQPDQVDRSKESRIYYPSRDDPEAIEICRSDMDCLAPGSYLTSTIMNFYIRYLQKPTSSTTKNRCDFQFFNTYFYKKLKGPTKNDKENSYKKFRRWWKGVNIFEKAYIFLPIHESDHWSLVIICIPSREDESGPIILHLDSLRLHDSSLIFSNVKRFLIEEWKFLNEEEAVLELPFINNIWCRLSRRIGEAVVEVPQQNNETDCGLFVLYFMERFIEEAPERLSRRDLTMFGRKWFRPEEASNLRQKIFQLVREEFEKASADTAESLL